MRARANTHTCVHPHTHVRAPTHTRACTCIFNLGSWEAKFGEEISHFKAIYPPRSVGVKSFERCVQLPNRIKTHQFFQEPMSHTCICARARTHTHAHAHTHTHTQTHTNTYKHTYKYLLDALALQGSRFEGTLHRRLSV